MKKTAFLTAGVVALAITFSVAKPGTGTANNAGGSTSIKGTNVTSANDTIKTKKQKQYAKKQMRNSGITKMDTVVINKGSATLTDGTDARGSGNNGTGGNGTGNNGNGGVGTGRPSGTGGTGTGTNGSGSGVKVKP